ncbi:hypothetical protein A2U01_0058695 [Trifolium medium]|uniref:Uncharacterized protein n=1 Tax=Trifolium medium TaxID=97028 RepID=A0A392RLG1_9FABA|nr:hypothetical protein [Trifolium medium]
MAVPVSFLHGMSGTLVNVMELSTELSPVSFDGWKTCKEGSLVVGGEETIATSSETAKNAHKKGSKRARVGFTRRDVGRTWRRVRQQLATKLRRGGRR